MNACISNRASDYRPWLEALPAAADLSLPISDAFTEEELLACQDAQTIHIAQSIRAMLEDAKEVSHALHHSVQTRALEGQKCRPAAWHKFATALFQRVQRPSIMAKGQKAATTT